MSEREYLAAVAAVTHHFGEFPHAVCILTFGCQQNEADSEKLRGMAHEMGYTDAADPADADLILLNTCAIREHAEQKVLSYVGRLKEYWEKNPALVVGICGCMTAQPHRVRQIRERYPQVSFTLDPASLDRLPLTLAAVLDGGKRTFVIGSETPAITEGLPTARTVRHRAWVSIMYGCNNFCSYCIVPYVRGRERSRASGEILREVASLVEGGCRDITLLGQNVNSYRGDCDFATLLDRVASLPGDFLLRFMTSHPKDVPDALIDVMAKHPGRIAPQFHLPLQSGSDSILSRMNRKYTRETYLETVEKLRRAIPDIVLSTDLIIGFPGETDEDFAETMQVVRDVRYDMIYSFLYSPRRGTPAATMPDPVPDSVRKARMAELLETQNQISLSLAERYVGQTLRILVDAPGKEPGTLTGRTPGGRLVHFAGDETLIGQFVCVTIDRAEPFALRGTMETAGRL